MTWKNLLRRPLLTMTQGIILLVVIIALFVGLDLNRRAQAGKLVGGDAQLLQTELERELERQEELINSKDYVLSDEFVVDYARSEGGMILPGEKKVSPTLPNAMAPASETEPVAAPTPDPAISARPWQAWWQLLTDAPMPTP